MTPRITLKKTWVAAVGLALAVSTAGGVALAAENPSGWYSGGNATLADPAKTNVALKLYNAAGVEVTSGSTTTPLAAFAAADGAVRNGDAYASLFVHLPQSTTAPGAWPGVQATGTGKFSGAGAVTAPATLSGKPYVATTAAGYTLADVVAGLPNNEAGASFAGVYELRLRTSSPTAGVSTEYAAAYLKVSGTSWTLTTSPVLGDSVVKTAVATTVAVTWPSKLAYGTASSVPVAVTAASGAAKPSGSVRLVSAGTTLGTANLSAAGTASFTLSKTALVPGSRALQVVYAGVANAFSPSQSAAKTIVVAKATPGRPAFKVKKAPTAKKGGTATVTVATPSGLAKAGGTAQLVLKKGKTTKKVKVAVKAGSGKVKLPKLPKGTWSATVTYAGDAHYASAKSKTVKVKVKKK
ncbi:hypothetical protein GCM10023350_44180 [Nocardioides endophyticus]|uniref:Bacterial Ig-like domain-containing protein n=2 Tax=Nocardioides endophyticus TaxID=1353775 RepID=A0ABP8ZDQ9_9ACTN